MKLASNTNCDSYLEPASINEALRMIAGEDEEDELAGMIAARLADLKNGERGNGRVAAPIGAATTEGKTRDEAAAEIRVSEFVTHDEFARPPRPRPRGSTSTAGRGDARPDRRGKGGAPLAGVFSCLRATLDHGHGDKQAQAYEIGPKTRLHEGEKAGYT
jgi:hypothetical protein